jgi:Homeodomain
MAGSLSSSPAPSPTGSSYDLWTTLEDLPAQITNPRKRLSIAQLQRLQSVFDASHYITREERHTLAHEIGLYVPRSSHLDPWGLMPAHAHRDVKFITVWFQNRRQSDKRKAWTKRDRAKKKENSCQRIDTVVLKPAISLDQIASRSERVQRPTRAEKPRSVLSSRKPENLVEPKTPTQSKPKALWAHMPSSPPEAPSSPHSETLQLLNAPRLVKSGKSLEWACAKARMGSKHRHTKDKRLRAVQPQTTGPRRPSAAPKKEKEPDEVRDEDVEAPASSSSHGQDDCTSPGATAAPKSPPGELCGKSTEDVEAAMVLLQFLRG